MARRAAAIIVPMYISTPVMGSALETGRGEQREVFIMLRSNIRREAFA